jgi:hypothetical protein
MREIGRMTRKRAKVFKLGQMVHATRASTSTERLRAKGHNSGPTAASMRAIGRITRRRAKGHFTGRMAPSMRVAGRIMSKTVSEFTHQPREFRREKSGKTERK